MLIGLHLNEIEGNSINPSPFLDQHPFLEHPFLSAFYALSTEFFEPPFSQFWVTPTSPRDPSYEHWSINQERSIQIFCLEGLFKWFTQKTLILVAKWPLNKVCKDRCPGLSKRDTRVPFHYSIDWNVCKIDSIGAIQKVRTLRGGGRGSSKSVRKRTRGRGG